MVRTTVPDKRNEKPDKQTGRNRNRHHEIADLMAEMHKFRNDKKCLSQRHDDEDAIQNMFGEKMGFIINDRNDQLNHRNAEQDPKRSPYRLCIEGAFLFWQTASAELICSII